MNPAADRWWNDARAAAVLAARKQSFSEDWDYARHDAALQAIGSPGWVPDRPGRRLPPMWAIASYWAERDDWFDVLIDSPHCFACGLRGGCPDGIPDPRARWNRARNLHRGHIVNRARDGLDGPQNLVPLCGACNTHMPVFAAEEEDDALAWIFTGGIMGEFDRRLEKQGLGWAARALAALDIMEQRGGDARFSEEDMERFKGFPARQAADLYRRGPYPSRARRISRLSARINGAGHGGRLEPGEALACLPRPPTGVAACACASVRARRPTAFPARSAPRCRTCRQGGGSLR